VDNSKESLCESIKQTPSKDEYDHRQSARTFMHTLGQDTEVGLLLFDEPSAALDPVAEHGIVLSPAPSFSH
jgi:ABC-type arginine transport system ATPase subunit